jgi:hypothetical protein
MQYHIYQEYFDPNYNQWINVNTMASGSMVDPKSTWIAAVDTTNWAYRVQGSDGHWYQAYYNIEIEGMDTSETQFTLEKRFPLGPASVQLAEITSPSDFSSIQDIITISVSPTGPGDGLSRVYGDVRRASDGKWIADLTFDVFPDVASASFLSYIFPNDIYDITVWGTTSNGSFIDRVRVQFSNPTIFSVDCIMPALWDTLTGLATIQLDIPTLYPLALMGNTGSNSKRWISISCTSGTGAISSLTIPLMLISSGQSMGRPSRNMIPSPSWCEFLS